MSLQTPSKFKIPFAIGAAFALALFCFVPTFLHLLGADFGVLVPTLSTYSELEPGSFTEMAFRSMSGNFSHTILEWTATVIAFFTVLLAFAHFSVRRDAVTPVIALSLLAAGTMDAFHTLAADRLISASADNQQLIPFTWAICRTFNAVIPLSVLVVLYLMRRWSMEEAPRRSVWAVGAAAIILSVLAAATIQYCASSENLPQTMFPGDVLTRPWDVFPLVIYAVSGLFIYPLFLRKVKSYFAIALWLSVIPDVVTQLHMAFGSTALFDHHFNVAHFTKIVAYAVPCFGLIFDYVQTYRQLQIEIVRRKDAQERSEAQSIEVRQQKRELQQSEARVRAIIDTANDMIIVIDEFGAIESVNPSTLRNFGYTEVELVGQNISLLMPSPDREAHDGYLKRYSRTSKATIIGVGRNVQAQRKDDSVFPAHLSVGKMLLGSKKYFVGIIRDATADKEKEGIRTELMEELQRSNYDLETFAHVASHDLQEPLRMVTSYTKLLEEEYRGKLSEEADEYIHFALDGATRMQQLIRELLEYSRVGQSRSRFSEIDMEQLVGHVVDDLQLAISDADAVVVCGTLPTLWGDSTLLRRLFQNLIANSLKFRSEKPLKVEVQTEYRGEWVFSVQDNGIGFDMIQKDRIFDIFQRLHTREEYEGTGMGLPICKKIVQRHGGRIWAEAIPNEGTTIYFTVVDQVQPDQSQGPE